MQPPELAVLRTRSFGSAARLIVVTIFALSSTPRSRCPWLKTGKEGCMPSIPKISTCLWFDNNAEEAVGFYVSAFGNSRVKRMSHYGKEGQDVHGGKPGSVM